MIEWMFYASLIGVLTSLVAEALHQVLLARGKAVRWIWLAALASSIALPVALPFLPQAPVELPALSSTSDFTLGPVDIVTAAVPGPTFDLAKALVIAWVGLSAIVLAFITFAFARLHALRRTWRRAEITAQPVLISSDTGPAVVGVWSPSIVVPAWLMDLAPEAQQLVLAHEREHIRARDPLLLAIAQAATVVLPWNVALWYQRRRLREGIELDCDARLLRNGHSRSAYAELLMAVGQRMSRSIVPLAAMAEPRSLLEKRVRQLLAPKARGRLHTFAWLAVGVLAITGAAKAPRPDYSARFAPGPVQEKPKAEPPRVVKVVPAPEKQQRTPPKVIAVRPPSQDTVKPVVTNAAELRDEIYLRYPTMLRQAGVGGTAVLWMLVDSTGRVTKVQLKRTSGNRQLDDLALSLTDKVQFVPARLAGKRISMWTEVPFVFTPNQELNPLTPVFTPYTVAPNIKNADEVVGALRRFYPPLLRDAGVGGTALVWFLIDEEGTTQKVMLKKTSGHHALDDAALKVAQLVRWTPALNRDRPVTVWIELPLLFKSDGGTRDAVREKGPTVIEVRAALQKHYPDLKPDDPRSFVFLVNNKGEVLNTLADPADAPTGAVRVRTIELVLEGRSNEEIEQISLLKSPAVGANVIWIQLK